MQLNHNGVHSEGHSFVLPQICPVQSSVESDFSGSRVISVPGPESNRYLERQQARESNARSYPRRIRIAISEAQGIYIKDVDGNIYFDCLAGAGTLALGHNHPLVVEAMRKVLDAKLPLHTLDLTTPVKDKFVEELFASLPAEFAENAKIQFCGP
ncbi:aminotransferase class III-fold pyridoxal phosphate-dependent enzyme [Halotia wernerae UHCC 0503]|nr:aminotransferase class III-fold pyridoxal phosphate-dependent enzyme [Halotia wernerae UHCC 0503]